MTSRMKPKRVAIPAGIVLLALGGCTVVPPCGPSVVALPRSGEPLAQFLPEPQPVYVGPAPRYVAPPMIIYPPYPYY